MAKYKVEITNLNTNDIIVLKNEETQELFKKYKDGDMEARERLIHGNLKLVLSCLRPYHNQNHNLDDLFQIGVMGLIKAIENFDLAYGVRLSTYAIPLISGEIRRYNRDNKSFRVSRSMSEMAYAILGYKEQYIMKHGCEPTSKEIADSLEIEEYQISQALGSLQSPVSTEEPIYNDGGDTIYVMDQVADKRELNRDKDLIITMNDSLQHLKERERNILLERFIIGKTQMEIAESLNISQAQVSRLEKNAITHMRKLMK